VHNTAAVAVALREAAAPSFRDYARQVVANARAMAEELMARGYGVVSGGTDNHLILVDLSSKNVPGKVAAKALDKAGIELNYNSVPYDTRKPFDPSGIRLGSPAITSRGMKEAEARQVAIWIDRVLGSPTEDVAERVLGEVRELTRKFPAPGIG
jgi:glycine hydroxymethyltransferase